MHIRQMYPSVLSFEDEIKTKGIGIGERDDILALLTDRYVTATIVFSFNKSSYIPTFVIATT